VSSDVRVRRLEKALAARGACEVVRPIDIEADRSGTATLAQYARIYADEIRFRRMFFVSELIQISGLTRDCCVSNHLWVIGYPPEAALPDRVRIGLFAWQSAATEEWVGNNWWSYTSRDLLYMPKEHWAAVRADFAITLLAVQPSASGVDLARDAFVLDAIELRRELFTIADGLWVPTVAVTNARVQLHAYRMTTQQAEWVKGWREALATSSDCNCDERAPG
jgi:hypothetical protein